MQIPQFRVLLATPTDEDPDATSEHVARVLHGDRLRAELEAPKHGLKEMGAAPMHFTTIWVWSSLARTHIITDDFRTFKPRVLALEAIEDEDEEADPTQLEAPTS